MSTPQGSTDQTGHGELEDDPQLRAYRDWALQSATLSVLDTGTAWRSRPAVLGLDDSGSPKSGSRGQADPLGQAELRGQAELQRELEPEYGFAIRSKTLAQIGAGALLALTINHLVAFGATLTDQAFLRLAAAIAATMTLILTVLPRLRPRAFAVAENAIMVVAWIIVATICENTGGAESPYAVWWLFPVFYAAYFLKPRVANVHAAIISVLAVAPLAYDASARDADSLFEIALLLGVIWVLLSTLLLGRERARDAERAVRFLALADPLTGVANLRAFERMLDRAVRGTGSQFALVLADLRGLKGANATFGYEVGDDMLRRVAAVMMHVSGEHDQVARLRGDEFAVMLPDADERQAEAWCRRVEAALDDHNAWVRSRLPQISVSLGSAIFPRDGVRPRQLFDVADRRMFEQKSRAVKPPHEVDVSTAASARELLKPDSDSDYRSGSRATTRPLLKFDIRWLAASIIFSTWAFIPGSDPGHRTALLGLAGLCLVFAFAGALIRGPRAISLFTKVSDLATLGVLVPGMWLTGGWQSPLQIASFFPIVYYAQFARGREAITRIAAVIALYAIGFWGAEAAGASPGPPSAAAQTEFAMIIAAQLVISVLLQYNRRVTDAAIRRIRDSATHDPLTSAFNLRTFRGDLTTALDRAGETPRPALLIADIDDFRSVNNLGGHLAGDAVLRESAERLLALCGEADKVYRIDSDEFALLTMVGGPERCDELLAAARERLDPVATQVEGLGQPVSASVGCALWDGSMDPRAMLETARADLESHRLGHAPRRPDPGGQTLL